MTKICKDGALRSVGIGYLDRSYIRLAVPSSYMYVLYNNETLSKYIPTTKKNHYIVTEKPRHIWKTRT